MAKLKLGPIADDKPVKVAVELPASLHRNLVAYAEILSRENSQPPTDPVRLIVPMLERFIATDRAFTKSRREVTGAKGRAVVSSSVSTTKSLGAGASIESARNPTADRQH